MGGLVLLGRRTPLGWPTGRAGLVGLRAFQLPQGTQALVILAKPLGKLAALESNFDQKAVALLVRGIDLQAPASPAAGLLVMTSLEKAAGEVVDGIDDLSLQTLP